MQRGIFYVICEHLILVLLCLTLNYISERPIIFQHLLVYNLVDLDCIMVFL